MIDIEKVDAFASAALALVKAAEVCKVQVCSIVDIIAYNVSNIFVMYVCNDEFYFS